ncbi:DotI/IcmL/TraM family protein [Candidatus Berkiella aquae]|uniref:DotI/IcmL/TraM family protein n=1 Tax=Candidatus Berkiella aquae TaxID=295108 RepID=A0A0Q9YW85_9GAMM|nr:DotI/IcmL/TraM family protein [Candidatus Berkiella aquae]MCS5711129.1 DotI/IcmL/TraM family protein [Candidatus Berkiella aquae]
MTSASDSGNKPIPPGPKSPLPSHPIKHNIIFSRKMLHGSSFYSFLLYASLGLISTILVLFTWDFYDRTHHPIPPSFAVSADDQLIRLRTLSQPNLTTEALLRWAATAATTIYTFDFYNYNEVLKDARVFFTKAGYENFRSAITAAGIINTIVRKRLVVSAVITDTPVVLKEGQIATGNYAWQVQFPMLLTYQSASEQLKSKIIITMLVSRVPTAESVNGVGIASFIVTESGPARK